MESPGEPPGGKGKKVTSVISPRPLELVYVYEVGAEELPPASLGLSQEFFDHFVPATAEDSGAAKAAQDEPLPFEARTAAVAATDASEVSQLGSLGRRPEEERGTPRSRDACRSGAKRESPESSSPRQPRLPGMD